MTTTYSPIPFISRDDLGDRLGQDLSTSDNAAICVDAACDICRTLAEQTFNEVPDDEIVLDGSGTDALALPELPVTDITSVFLGEDELVADTDFKLNGNGILLKQTGIWAEGRQNITVIYTHGYPSADFPRDVRMAALTIAEELFTTVSTAGIQSETLGAYTVSYKQTATAGDANPLAQRLLDRHRPRR